MYSNDDIAIRVSNLSKCYQIYETPRDRLKQFVFPRLQHLAGRSPKQYFREFWALRDVSFEIKKGETVGIIGRNGSGKSTLLQMICGTLNPTGGSIQTHGRIAALLELGSGFNPEFTGRENVYMNASVLGLSNQEIDARFDEIAAFAEIGDFIEQPVKTYSSGMVVRLAFAVSVSVCPDILVVDEALAVGDMAFQQKCLQRLEDLRAMGTTVLMVSHDIMLIRNYCTHTIYLSRGAVKRIGDTELIGELYLHDMFSEIQDSRRTEKIGWREGDGTGRIAFGSTRGRIVSAHLTGSQSDGNVFQQGETIQLDICGEAAEDVKNPEFVFQIRDAKGYVLYGLPTSPQDLLITPGPHHVNISARISLNVELGAGNYAIAVGFNDRQGATLFSILDKVVAIAEFSVAENKGTLFHGCINLHGTWKTPDNGTTGCI